jgi:hypothetical protein
MIELGRRLVVLALSTLVAIAACAIITVNVYFPEKDVKSAYKSLEDELLEPAPKPKQNAPPTAPRPSGHLVRPAAIVVAGRWEIALAADALAEDDLSRRITEEIKNYPEVVEAYKGLGHRLTRLNELREKGLVGEGRDGKAVLRARPPQVGAAEARLVEEENRDREVIIAGMAKAILKLTGQEATPANLATARNKAADTFASLRRDKAQVGWWIQLPDGTWKQK